jgi:hypothetical protein
VLDWLALGKFRRFAIWYLLARQLSMKNAPFGAFFIDTHPSFPGTTDHPYPGAVDQADLKVQKIQSRKHLASEMIGAK